MLGAVAERFGVGMKQTVPELLNSQPDLLFQLATLLATGRLKKAGVRCAYWTKELANLSLFLLVRITPASMPFHVAV